MTAGDDDWRQAAIEAWLAEDARLAPALDLLTDARSVAVIADWARLRQDFRKGEWAVCAAGLRDLTSRTLAEVTGPRKNALRAAVSRLVVRIAEEARRLRKAELARQAVEAALRLRPDNSSMLSQRADLRSEDGDLAGAGEDARRALTLDALNVGAARTLRDLGLGIDDDRVANLRQRVAEAGNLEIGLKRGVTVLITLNRPVEAEQLLDAHLADLPAGAVRTQLTDTHARLALDSGRFDIALERYGQSDTRTAALGRIQCLLELGRLEEAEQAGVLDQGARSQEDAFEPERFSLHLAHGRIREAYDLYRRRPRSEHYRRAFPRYLDVLGDIDAQLSGRRPFFINEGGVGDEIRLASLYDEMLSRWGVFDITCDPRLLRMFRERWPTIGFHPVSRLRRGVTSMSAEGRERARALKLWAVLDDVTLVTAGARDVTASLYDVLASLRFDRGSFEGAGRPLTPRAADSALWRERLPSNTGRIRVAVSWRSLMRAVRRDIHYFTPELFAPVVARSDIDLFIVQPEAEPDELAQFDGAGARIIETGIDLRNDLESVAALLSRMDLVIGPGSTTTELAAALGRPSWLISDAIALQWRAGPDRRDIWHRSATILTGAEAEQRLATLRTPFGSD